MPSERRDLRPFDDLPETHRRLNQLLRAQCPPIPDDRDNFSQTSGLEPIGVANGTITTANRTLVLNDVEYTTGAVGISFGTSYEDWTVIRDAAKKELEAIFGPGVDAPVDVVVTAANPRLKQTVTLLSVPAKKWLSGDWRYRIVDAGGEGRPRPFKMPKDGCRVTVQLLLNAEVPEERRVLGRPWRKGSWLARAEFRVASAKGSGLAPRPLTDSVRQANGLGPSCTFFARTERDDADGSCLAQDISDLLTIYLDEELLRQATEAKSNGDPLRPGAPSLINRWLFDTYRSVVHLWTHDSSLGEFDIHDLDHRNTFLYALLQRLLDAELIETLSDGLMMLQSQPFHFLTRIEELIGMRQSDTIVLALRSGGRA